MSNNMHQQFKDMFFHELRDMHSAESQIAEAMPKFIEAVSNQDLRASLEKHLMETKQHKKRLEELFSRQNKSAEGKFCAGMKGIISECEDVMKQDLEGPVKDANLIATIQKIEHYEIATYGVLKTFAKHLQMTDVEKELSSIEREECKADQMLTNIAEGGWFSTGINKEAAGQ